MSITNYKVPCNNVAGFSETQKNTARNNIGAAPMAGLTAANYAINAITNQLAAKQDLLVAGSGINIADNVISTTNTLTQTDIAYAETCSFTIPAKTLCIMNITALCTPTDNSKVNYATVNVMINGISGTYSYCINSVESQTTGVSYYPGNIGDSRSLTYINTTSDIMYVTITIEDYVNYPLSSKSVRCNLNMVAL